MTQDNFNRLYTLFLTSFFMVLFVYVTFTGKVIDWQALSLFLIPTLNHIAHQFTAASITNETIKATSAQLVAVTQANGGKGG